MAVPFGFSAGDFMAAIHLVHKITTALRETDGASSEFNQTICQLQGLDGLLRSVQSVQSAHSADVDPQQLDRLQILGRECYIPLNRFFSKIKVLEPALGSSFATNHSIIDKAKRVARKVQWGLQVKKELSELTIAMGPRISAINMQLLLINFERERKAGSSLDTLVQGLNDLNSQIGNLQRSLDIRIDSLATMTSMENVSQALQDIRLEATNHHNSQIDTIREQIVQAGSINAKVSQQMLDSIQLLTSKIEVHDAFLRTDATQSTTSRNPGLESYPVDESGSSCHAQGAMQRVEDQLAAQTKLLQLLTERDLTRQSSSSLLEENSDITLQEVQEAIQKSIQLLFGFFRGCADALLLKLWIILPVAQHILRNLQAPRLIASITMGENIMFEDVLGRVVRLPYQHFRHYPVFIARLQCEFKGIPGENQVLLNQFRIFKQERYNDFLTNDNWEVTVRPGSRIAMSVLLARRDSEGNSCPRCKTNKAGETTEGLLHCTACGLSWALQKFDTSNPSSGGPGVEEFASDLPPVPNISDTEEGGPSSPSISLSDPSDVPSPLADEKDIKSFRMVHIEKRNPSTHTDVTSLITSSLERLGFSWEHLSSKSLTVDSVLTTHVQRGPSPMLYVGYKPFEEFLYIFSCKGSSNILRIGSSRDVKRRFNEWTRKCGPIYEYDPKLYEEGTAMMVPWSRHVLQLVHAELMDHQLRVKCKKCLVIHHDIFHVSKNHAMRVIQKWRQWILSEPYMRYDDGRWKLKPLFEDYMAGFCRPLAMRN